MTQRERKIVLFVDGSNFGAAVKAAGFRVDYDRIRQYFNEFSGARLVGSYYFTALPPRTVESTIRKLTDRLQYNGWDIVTKETKTFQHATGPKVKGNMDVEIAVKAMKMADKITDLVLFSGDGDFRCLVEALQEQTINVTCISYHANDSTCIVADELRRQVNEFINLPQLREFFEIKSNTVDVEIVQRRRRFLDGS